MEIKESLKAHRTRLGLSQEELAERIYVSRQTISNWETDRTYPDVQSLLLLSSLFDTSIDELVKGDVETMKEAIMNNWKKMNRLATTAWILTGVGMVCLVLGFTLPSGPSSIMPNLTEGNVLGVALFLMLWALGMVLLGVVEFLKRQYDLVTYQDVLAYSQGREPERDQSQFGRRHPGVSLTLKIAIGVIAGAVVGWVLFHLIG